MKKQSTKKKMIPTPFLKYFLENIRRLRMFYNFIAEDYPKKLQAYTRIILKLEGKKVEPTEEEKKERLVTLELSRKEANFLRRLMKDVRKDYQLLLPFIRSQILIFAVSLFEYYIKDIIEYICLRKPSMLKAKDKNITYDKLLSFKSIEEIHSYIVEKESFSLGYLSYEELSGYFKKKCKIDFSGSGIPKDDLIEIFLIRNVLLHNKGIVNRTFLEKLGSGRCKLGQVVEIDEKTLRKSLELVKKQVEYIDNCVIRKFK